jgi:hypothetical protein
LRSQAACIIACDCFMVETVLLRRFYRVSLGSAADSSVEPLGETTVSSRRRAVGSA